MNSTLSWTAVLNQNGGWRLGAHQGSLHYTAPDRGSRVEKKQGREKEKDAQGGNLKDGTRRRRRRGLIEMGDTKWKRERGEGMESETTKGSGRERGMDGLREGKERKMLVYLNPSVASLNHGSPVILEIAHCNSPAPRF